MPPQGCQQAGSGGSSSTSSCTLKMTLDELKDINKYAESTKSLSFLPLVSRDVHRFVVCMRKRYFEGSFANVTNLALTVTTPLGNFWGRVKFFGM